MSDNLVPDDFRALAEPLRLELKGEGGPTTVELRVESVADLPTHHLRASPFAMVLLGPRAPALAQATYALRHPRLGMIDVFLVPIAQDATSRRYEATFN